ncbi:MAG: sigma-70 family RNA polymerase sigma factor [Phycisphaera sp.]|nr:sigma-70 family RNA polymerase sigma factor [Phycisphaera sp.]
MISDRHIEFFRQLTDSQSRLYAYILSLVSNPEVARDVLQETNLVLIRKAAEFEPGSNFIAWSFAVSRYQVMASRTRSSRDRLVFCDEVLDAISGAFDEDNEQFEDQLDALSNCMAKLPDSHRELIRQRYQDARPVKAIAEELGQSANSVAVMLHRIRKTLMECIEGAAGPSQAHEGGAA